MRISVEQDDDRPVVGVSGLLDLPAAARLRIALLKAAAEQPEAVICDLTGVRAQQLALSVFLTVADEVGSWPSCPVVLVVPDHSLRSALLAPAPRTAPLRLGCWARCGVGPALVCWRGGGRGHPPPGRCRPARR